MKLPPTAQILFPDCKNYLTNQTLIDFRSHGIGPHFWHVAEQFSDLQLFTTLLNFYSPLTLYSTSQLILQGRLKRFPYRLNDQAELTAFTLHLVPVLGDIAALEIEKSDQFTHIWQNPTAVILDLCRPFPRFRLLISYQPTQSEPTLVPPHGYTKLIQENPH